MSWDLLGRIGAGALLVLTCAYVVWRAWWVTRGSAQHAADDLARRWHEARDAGRPFEYRAGTSWLFGALVTLWLGASAGLLVWVGLRNFWFGCAFLLCAALTLVPLLCLAPPFPADAVRVADGVVHVRRFRARGAPLAQVEDVRAELVGAQGAAMLRFVGTDLTPVPGMLLQRSIRLVGAELRTLVALERGEPMPDLAPVQLGRGTVRTGEPTRHEWIRWAALVLPLIAVVLGLVYWWRGPDGLVHLATQVGLTWTTLAVLGLVVALVRRRRG